MKNPLRHKPWLWVVLAFVLQLGAWGVWFTLAAKHKVAEVPLQPRSVPQSTQAGR